MEKVKIGAIYEHYKGKKYKVLSIGRHSEDLKLYVVYQGLYNCESFGENPIWIGPLDMFVESIMINGSETARFKEISY